MNTEFEGLFIIENFHTEDTRGSFTKIYHQTFFEDNNLNVNFKESYFSISKRNVIRGMHFQTPPYDHEKLVCVTHGEVLDVILDLRKSSKTYGKTLEITLSETNHRSLFIPKGVAHGYKAQVDNTIMLYNVTTVYNQEFDSGIRYDSFGFDWKVAKPLLSDRDISLTSFDEFRKINPF